MSWREEFLKDYFNYNDESLWDESLNLKNSKIPPKLYKFTNTNHLYELLVQGLVYLPKISQLNDPMEGKMLYDFDEIFEEYNSILMPYLIQGVRKYLSLDEENYILESDNPLEELLEIGYYQDKLSEKGISLENYKNSTLDKITIPFKNNLDNLNNSIKNSTVLYCLLENDYKNNKMWADYGDEGKVICIEYNIRDCDDIQLINKFFFITYSEYKFTDDLKLLLNQNPPYFKFVLLPFLMKSPDWSSEKEWRCIFYKHKFQGRTKHNPLKNEKNFYYKFPKPRAIFLGWDISNKDEKRLINICRGKHIDLYKMKKIDSSYQLDYNAILEFDKF